MILEKTRHDPNVFDAHRWTVTTTVQLPSTEDTTALFRDSGALSEPEPEVLRPGRMDRTRAT